MSGINGTELLPDTRPVRAWLAESELTVEGARELVVYAKQQLQQLRDEGFHPVIAFQATIAAYLSLFAAAGFPECDSAEAGTHYLNLINPVCDGIVWDGYTVPAQPEPADRELVTPAMEMWAQETGLTHNQINQVLQYARLQLEDAVGASAEPMVAIQAPIVTLCALFADRRFPESERVDFFVTHLRLIEPVIRERVMRWNPDARAKAADITIN